MPIEELARHRGLRRGRSRTSCSSAPAPSSRSRTSGSRRGARNSASADEIAAIDGVTPALLVALGEKGVKSLDDLADLAADELIEMAAGQVKLEEAEAKAIIMAARAHWFADEDAGRGTHGTIGGVSIGGIGSEPGAARPRTAAFRGAADGDGRGGRAALPRHRRGAAEDRARPLRRRSRGPDRARCHGASARPGFVVDGAARYSGAGGGQAPVRAGGAGDGHRRRGVGGSRRGAARGAVLQPARAWRGAPARRLPASPRCARSSASGDAAVLVEAADGGADARGKLEALAPGVPVVDRLTCAELSAAFGREHVVHAALAPGRLGADLPRRGGAARRLSCRAGQRILSLERNGTG